MALALAWEVTVINCLPLAVLGCILVYVAVFGCLWLPLAVVGCLSIWLSLAWALGWTLV